MTGTSDSAVPGPLARLSALARRRGPQGAAASGATPPVPVPARAVADRSVKYRRSFIAGAPIVGFTGVNGAGKTLVAVSCIINDDLRAGRPVYSTVQIDSEFGSSIPLLTPRQLVELHDCTVFLDEVAVIFSSRDSLQTPREFDIMLQTLRHKNVTVRWTAPAWKRADVRLREATQVVVGCQVLGKRVKPGEFWPTPLTILAGALDTVSIGVDDTPERVLKRRIFVPQMLAGWGAYDTLAATPKLGHPPTGGPCVDCGGMTSREKCSPERHAWMDLPPPAVTGPEPVPARRR